MERVEICKSCSRFRVGDDYWTWGPWMDGRQMSEIQIHIAQQAVCSLCERGRMKRRASQVELVHAENRRPS